jgi:para-aminobenzoate synthetase component 1
MAAVQRIKDYIAAGDVYQVNLSQRFETEFGGNPFDLFKTLYDINPAPFYAYIQAGDHTIVSTSPERFLQRIGPRVETRPIKGTRPRGYTAAEDRRMQKSLLESKKDDAELSMIVDLLRNDLGRACAAGTVQVQTHKRIEAYQNVYHLVSDVVGELDRGKDSVDLIKATFPGGSITGCPKIRSMEIIDELEPHRRHIYTGSIGYISFHQTMDLSIAIRTATVYDKKLFLSVGGGIVYDSDPADEYDETLHKGRTFTEVLKDQQNLPEKSNWVWINGQYKPAQEAQVPVSDLGLQYGYGFFETIRVSQGMAGHLEAHLNRFYNAWQRFFNLTPPDLTWQDIFLHLIRCNGLENQTAAVKLMATFGTPDTGRLHPTLIALARPYVHRLQDLNRSGLYLATYPEARQTPLADYKTMNYLYYFLAGKWARENGADEALVLNPDGNISETNTANIFLIKDKTVYRPASAHVLPGIMETEVLKLLENWDYRIEKRAMPSASLFTAEQVILTNALMGAVPVEKVDGRQTAKPNDLCERINRKLLI